MKITGFILSVLFIFIATLSFGQSGDKLVSTNTHIKFFSSTPAEDIESNNYATTSTINAGNGAVVFSVPMQGFQFEKSLMQKHFNQKKFLDTKTYPNARLVAVITNLDEIDFSTDGTYDAVIEGDLTIRGVTNKIKENGTVTVKGDMIKANTVFNVKLADYEIGFDKGKPSTNIADVIEVTVLAEYEQE